MERLSYVKAARCGWYRQGPHNCIANYLWVEFIFGSMNADYLYVSAYKKEMTRAFETSAITVTYDLPRQCGEPVEKAVPPSHTPSEVH